MTDTSVATPLTADEKFEKLIAVLSQQKLAFDMGALREVLTETQQATAKSMQKAMRPENETHPGISAFSYPEGDVAHPRPVLPFEFFWNNYPMHMFPETEHWRELELACLVQPGEFMVLRKDGSKMTVSVKAERNANNQITKMMVEFPITREDKWLIPPKIVTLYQLVYPDQPRKRFMEGMQEFLQLTMGAEAD